MIRPSRRLPRCYPQALRVPFGDGVAAAVRGLKCLVDHSGRLNTNIDPMPVPTMYCLPSTA